jgi:hypothetical protein
MSEAPTHRIRDEIIELRADDPTLARALLERVSSLHRRTLVAVIDRVCSQLSPGDRVHRIDTLELELGSFEADELSSRPADHAEFEAEFVRRFEPALHGALSRAIRELDEHEAAAGSSARSSAIELLELFLTTGNLPWWADRSRPELVAEQLAEAAAKHPRALRLLLERSVASTRREQLRRLVHHLDEDAVTGLIEVLAGGDARALAVIAHSLVQLVRSTRPGPANVRATVWCAVLRSSGAGVGELDGRVDALLYELARELDVPTPKLCDEFVEFVERGGHDCPAVLRSALERGATPRPTATPRQRAGDEAARSEDSRAEPSTDDSMNQTRAAELAALLDSWHEGPLRELAVALRAVAHACDDGGQTTVERLGQLTALALHDGSLSVTTLRRSLALLHTTIAAEQLPAIERSLLQAVDRAALTGRSQPAPAATPERPHPTHLPDRLHVADAGCVIAWPFLERLFTRLELVERKTFVSPSAACRGVALLHQLASEDPDPPEFELPLTKLLCGLAPDAPFELDRPLERSELDESERMLEALIAHATILRDMSVDGLRANFLRRDGFLATRDGGWLLQVERRSHDVVLDRFPWTWTWVRLPWMTTPLRVEW